MRTLVVAGYVWFSLLLRISTAYGAAGWLVGPLDNGAAPNGADDDVFATTLWDPDGNGPMPTMLVAGGTFKTVEGTTAHFIAVRDPSTGHWQPLGRALSITASYSLTVYNGELIAGGASGGSSDLVGISRWTGTQWAPLGGGIIGFTVRTLTTYNGDLIAGGDFSKAGGIPCAN